jgi:hypothetical protein
VPLKEATIVDFLLVAGGLASATAAESLRIDQHITDGYALAGENFESRWAFLIA